MEKANVLIYGLNAMIDHAERESKVPIRKKGGTKQIIIYYPPFTLQVSALIAC